ncbi:MAG: ATP-grasp domain-containing protein [Nanoarchaeota archaeon]|nr:ATP-grasp domain-containing protein [Nanoarchaeota archaeon]
MNIVLLYSSGDVEKAVANDFEGRAPDLGAGDLKEALCQLGHHVVMIPADERMLEELPRRNAEGKIDMVFNMADEGYCLNAHLEPHIPAFLDLLGIPYTGANHATLADCLDKPRTKLLLASEGLATPEWFMCGRGCDGEIVGLRKNHISFPMIVKPAATDGSVGITKDSVVYKIKDLERKAIEIARTYGRALVEEFIDGRELIVAMLGSEEEDFMMLPPSEIVYTLPEGDPKFLPYESKWNEDSDYFHNTESRCPARIDADLENRLRDMSVRACRLMGVRDYGRVDFRLKKGGPYILEVNPNPDITPIGGLTKMAKAAGMSYRDLIEKILASAIHRQYPREISRS